MSTSVIAILRHADYQQPANVPSAWLPHPLTEAGIRQAKEAAPGIAAFAHDEGLTICETVDCSRMLRAWQTANLIREALGLSNVEETELLAERSVGAVANLTTTRIEQLLVEDPRYDAPPPGWKSSMDYRLPFQGSESLSEAGRRVARHIQVRQEELAPATLKVIVGHGASLRHAAMHLGILNQDNVASVSMYHATPVFIRKTSSGWEKVSGDWKPRKQSEVTDEFGAA